MLLLPHHRILFLCFIFSFFVSSLQSKFIGEYTRMRYMLPTDDVGRGRRRVFGSEKCLGSKEWKIVVINFTLERYET